MKNFQQKPNSILEKVKTPDTLLTVVIFTILATAIHTFVVIYNSSELNVWVKWMPALLFTGALATAVLIFTVHNNKNMTILFAVIQGLLNALYYATTITWTGEKVTIEGLTISIFVALVVSVSLPLAEFHYAKLLNEITQEPTTIEPPAPQINVEEIKAQIMAEVSAKYAKKRALRKPELISRLNHQ